MRKAVKGIAVILAFCSFMSIIGAFPIVSAESEYFADNESDPLISLEISWEPFSFTYSESGMKWDPYTHTYKNPQSSQWIPSQNSNYISITNNSDVDVNVAFAFTAEDGFEDLCGAFLDHGTIIENDVVIARATSKEFEFLLDGSIPVTTSDRALGGTVRITVSS